MNTTIPGGREVKSELIGLRKSFSIFSALISQIFDIAPSPISFSSLARKLGISRPTLEEYVEILENTFLGKVVYWKDHSVIFRKEKKLILRTRRS